MCKYTAKPHTVPILCSTYILVHILHSVYTVDGAGIFLSQPPPLPPPGGNLGVLSILYYLNLTWSLQYFCSYRTNSHDTVLYACWSLLLYLLRYCSLHMFKSLSLTLTILFLTQVEVLLFNANDSVPYTSWSPSL